MVVCRAPQRQLLLQCLRDRLVSLCLRGCDVAMELSTLNSQLLILNSLKIDLDILATQILEDFKNLVATELDRHREVHL